MPFGSKPLALVDESDLARLIKRQQVERQSVEYKRVLLEMSEWG
jgi:hypothetical protein